MCLLLDTCHACSAKPGYQLQPGIWIDDCVQNGTMTGGGWTQAALREFLSYLDKKGVKVVTIWTNDAFLLPETTGTCEWFVPELRKWALNGH